MRVKHSIGLLRVSIKILLLEDDILFGETLVDLLEDTGYEVCYVTNGSDALDATYKAKFDLYLLDINVPLIDGISLLRELRVAEDDTPAFFLTSHKDKSKLQEAFKSGCDDYLSKPFDNDELLLRIEALFRRLKKEPFMEVGKLSHDKVHQRILYDNKELELSKKEYELLVLLMQHATKVVPKELIVNTLWSASESASDGAVRVYINRLKQVLKDVKIENIRAIGYKLVP
jgi:DNA-binding response OmpR family regulator